jgi:capsule polysaccharide export protein KpsE/RkpR
MNKETSAAAARRAKETATESVAEPTVSSGHPASAAVAQRASREHSAARMRLLWDSRRPLTRFTATGFVLALVTALLIPKQFVSTTRLMPPDQGNSMATMAALAGKIGDSVGGLTGVLPGMKTTGELFVGVLGSRSVQDDLIQKFDLRKRYRASRWEDARKILAARTTINEDRKSGIITIQVADRNPREAAALAGEYVAALNRVVVDLNTSSAHRERVFLEERLSEVKQSLAAAEHEFSEFSSKNAAIDIKEQGRAMAEATGRLEGELIAAQTELQGLRQIYTDSNVRIRATQARVNELRRQLPRLGGKTDAPTFESGDLYPAIRKLPLLGVTFADLYRSTRIQEAVFETLTKQYEVAKVEEAKEVPSVRILDSPEIPERKSFPPRTVITLLGAFTAFLLGIAWVLGGAAWMRWDVQDPRRVLIEDVGRTVFGKFSWASSNGHASALAWSRIMGRKKVRGNVSEGSERTLSRTEGGEVSSSEGGGK